MGKCLAVALLLSGGLIFAVVAETHYAITSEDDLYKKFNYHLPSNVVPCHYDISLTLRVNSHDDHVIDVHGESRIIIEVFEETRVISLHYVGHVTKVTITNDGSDQIVPSHDSSYETETVNLHFENVLQPGHYDLIVQYNSSLSEKAIFTVPYLTKSQSWIIYTIFPLNGARYVFPCWDEPGIKSTFRMYVRHHWNHVAYSNTLIEEETTISDLAPMHRSTRIHHQRSLEVALSKEMERLKVRHQISWTHFKETPKIHSYDVTITIVPGNMIARSLSNGFIWHRPHLEPLLDSACETMTRVISYLSWYMHCADLKPNYAVIPGIRKDGIVNQGLVVFREAAVVYDKELDPIMQRINVLRLMVRTLASSWFHSMVSPSWWTDFWLNEALAAFFQTKIYEQSTIERTLFLIQTQHDALHLDNYYGVLPLETKRSFENTVLFSYSLSVKAPAIFSMLERTVTPPVFRNGFLQYLHTYRHKHATSDDLWDAMQTALDKSDVEHGDYKVKETMRSWIQQYNYPIIEVKRSHNDEIIVSQQIKDEIFSGQWWIPITYTVQKDLNFSNTVPRVWLSPRNSSVTLDPIGKHDWIIVNVQQSGYYRVKYERWNWQLIANHLNSENFRNIHVLNRAKIIDDAYYFMMIEQLDYDMFFKLTSYLSQETHYAAWYPMFKIFEYLSSFLPFQESHVLKTHMKKILNGLLLEIGFDEDPYENLLNKFLRQDALKWACILGDINCKRAARVKLQEHLENPVKYKLLPNWKDWTYCNGLLEEDSRIQVKLWIHLMRMKNSSRKLFDYLSCIKRSYNAVHTYLKFISNDNIMKRNERIDALYSAIARYAQGNVHVILRHLEKYGRYQNVKTLSVLIHHVYSENELHKIKKYAQRKYYNTTILQDIHYAISVRSSYIEDHVNRMSKLFGIERTFSNKMHTSEESRKPPYRLIMTSNGVEPFHYNIEMEILDHDENQLTIEGNYSIKIAIYFERDEIQMHFMQHKSSIRMVSMVNETDISIGYPVSAESEDVQRDILILQFANVLSPGNYTLNMRVRNTLNETDGNYFKGSHTNENGTKVWLGALHFKPIGAARAFPCWDEPGFKTTFNISVRHRRMYRILSNMPAQRIAQDPLNDYVLSRFGTTPPMSINSVAMVVIPYDYYENSTQTMNLWCQSSVMPHVQYVIQIADIVNGYLQHVTMFQNISKINHFVTRDTPKEVIGFLGLIIYNEAYVVYDYKEKSDPFKRLVHVIPSIAAATARQWFGDVIGPSKWSDLWLNEGLAVFFANQAVTQLTSKAQMRQLLTVMLQQESLHLDTNDCMKPLSVKVRQESELKSVMSFSVYVKAPTVIRMLQHIISEDKTEFLNIMQEYFKMYRFQTVTHNDLWTIIQKKNSDNLRIGDTYNLPNLKISMNNWIKEMHYPVLKVIRNYNNNTVTILQQNLNILDSNRWWIPVTYTTQTELSFDSTLPKLWLNPSVRNCLIPEKTVYKDEWIIANLQRTGYYRVNYDPTNWKLIADYLNSENYLKIHVLNRAQIVDDAYHLMMTLQLDYHIFLRITSYLSREMDYVAWYPMLKILEYLSPFLPFQESTPLKYYVLKILNGYLEHKHETYVDNEYMVSLKQEVTKWACIFGDPSCKRKANEQLTEHLKDPAQHKLLPDWKEWIYCNGLSIANRITWLKFWSIYGEMSNDKILQIISCSGGFVNPNLHLNINASKLMSRQECIGLSYFIMMNEKADLGVTLANLKDHISYCQDDTRDVIKVLTVIIHHLYFEHQFCKVEEFVDNVLGKQDIANIQYTIIARQYNVKNHKNTFSVLIKDKN